MKTDVLFSKTLWFSTLHSKGQAYESRSPASDQDGEMEKKILFLQSEKLHSISACEKVYGLLNHIHLKTNDCILFKFVKPIISEFSPFI